MRTEVQNQLITAYEELAVKRAACNAVMAVLASVCAEYGLDENVLNALNERARRAVVQRLPAVAGALMEQTMYPVEKQSNEDQQSPAPAH